MTERYTEDWMGDPRIKFVLMCSQMDELNPEQQVWLEAIVTRIQEIGNYTYDKFGYKGRKTLSLLAKSMESVQRVGKKTRKWVITRNAEEIAHLENRPRRE